MSDALLPRVGEIPRKRHVRVPHPIGQRVPRRGADGDRRLLAGVGAALPPALPQRARRGDGDRRPARASAASPIGRWCPATCARAPSSRWRRRRSGRRALLGNDDVVLSWVAARRGEPALPQRVSATSSSTSTPDGRRWRRRSACSRSGEGDYVVVPTGTTHRWVPDGAAGADLYVIESRRGHITVPARYLGARGQLLEGAPFSERDLRAPAAADRGRGRRPRRRRAQPGRAVAPAPRAPPVRRRRLGRLPVPVRLLDPRLRADRRRHPPAATGAPDLRRRRLRRVLVRAATVRLLPRRDQGAVPPLQRRQRRGAVLRRRATS